MIEAFILPQATTQLDMTKWPAPVVRLFLGQMTEEAVFTAAADDPDPKKKKDQVIATWCPVF